VLTASDALALLYASIDLGAELACPQCPSGAGTGIDLAIDGECHGAHVVIPTSALPAGGVDCSIDPYVKALPCVSTLASGVDSLQFDVRDTPSDVGDCLLGAMTLLSCHGEDEAIAAMAESAVVTCGCGCETECPTPRVCVSSPGGRRAPCRRALRVGRRCTLQHVTASSPKAKRKLRSR
jgi:hypothetical protein